MIFLLFADFSHLHPISRRYMANVGATSRLIRVQWEIPSYSPWPCNELSIRYIRRQLRERSRWPEIVWANFFSLGLHGESYEWIHESDVSTGRNWRYTDAKFVPANDKVLAWNVQSIREWRSSTRKYQRLFTDLSRSKFIFGGPCSTSYETHW